MISEVKIVKMTIDEASQYSAEYCREHFPVRYERAESFRFREDRLRCIGAGVLLYEKLGLEDKDLRVGEFGKPYSDSCIAQFNLSHSGEYVVLAVADRPVGVDIEKIGRMDGRRRESLAGHVLTMEEKTWVGEGTDAGEKFSRLWTLKESATKALGCGMNRSFNSFSVLPLIHGETIGIEGTRLSGRTELLDGYSLSACLCETGSF